MLAGSMVAPSYAMSFANGFNVTGSLEGVVAHWKPATGGNGSIAFAAISCSKFPMVWSMGLEASRSNPSGDSAVETDDPGRMSQKRAPLPPSLNTRSVQSLYTAFRLFPAIKPNSPI